ncbi:2-oxo acid dehydrogenase [Rhodococcus olei]|uniref:2-oxo acid dehydrogenase n=1 Tax=Rhodococcus olei TaxID=2161675 RepID=A0ABP8NYH6_9NOCA
MTGRAVSRRGSGWGRSLLSAIERGGASGRLGRGRSHVRAGQVFGVRVAPGLVVGEVQGSQNEPFTATVTIRRLDEDAVGEVIGRVRGTPGLLAAVASGALPAELGELLLPAGPGDVDFGCTCPDQGWLCRHAAALVTVTAEHVDSTPTTLLTLRGVDLDSLIRGVDASAEVAPDPRDWYGEGTELPALPRPEFAAAPRDLNPGHLRSALRATAPDERAVAQGLRDLDALYRALGGD